MAEKTTIETLLTQGLKNYTTEELKKLTEVDITNIISGRNKRTKSLNVDMEVATQPTQPLKHNNIQAPLATVVAELSASSANRIPVQQAKKPWSLPSGKAVMRVGAIVVATLASGTLLWSMLNVFRPSQPQANNTAQPARAVKTVKTAQQSGVPQPTVKATAKAETTKTTVSVQPKVEKQQVQADTAATPSKTNTVKSKASAVVAVDGAGVNAAVKKLFQQRHGVTLDDAAIEKLTQQVKAFSIDDVYEGATVRLTEGNILAITSGNDKTSVIPLTQEVREAVSNSQQTLQEFIRSNVQR